MAEVLPIYHAIRFLSNTEMMEGKPYKDIVRRCLMMLLIAGDREDLLDKIDLAMEAHNEYVEACRDEEPEPYPADGCAIGLHLKILIGEH